VLAGQTLILLVTKNQYPAPNRSDCQTNVRPLGKNAPPKVV